VENRDELMFILSSADRMKMLSALAQERMRLSSLSSRSSMTVQEGSRQVGRLQAAKLVEKDPDGLYVLTGLGRLVLKLLPSFDFLVENREYLLTHELNSVPPEFVERIGELSGAEQGRTLGDILRHFQEVMSSSREYVWLMADQVLLLDEVAAKALDARGVPIRIVIPRSVLTDEDYSGSIGGFNGKVELGLVESVGVGMALNERLAGVIFPGKDGRADFDSGLRGLTPAFHRWCSDLFLFYWNQASRISY